MPDYIKPAFFLFFVLFAAGMSGGFMAADRGRNVPAWCILCALLPPLLLFLFFAKPLHEVERMFKKCWKCGEFIKWRAETCKHCKSLQPDH